MTREKILPWLFEGTQLGKRILEVGAGPGAATAELTRRADVTSLEYSHNFCVAVRSKSSVASIVQADAAALPFASRTFTAVIAVLVLHHLKSSTAQDQALAEIFRVLTPGGVFVALEISDSWLGRLAHMRSTFVPVAVGELPSSIDGRRLLERHPQRALWCVSRTNLPPRRRSALTDGGLR